MRIRAYVSHSTKKTEHYRSAVDNNGQIEKQEQIPTPYYLEILEEEDGFFLYHFDSENTCIADSWHENLEEAKNQAMFEFGILKSQWSEKD